LNQSATSDLGNNVSPTLQVRPVGLAAVLFVALGTYWVLLGGTDAGNYVSVVRALNAGLAAVCIWLWVRDLARASDVIDVVMLATLLCFLAASVLTAFPRTTLDAATSAMGWVAALFIARRVFRQERIRLFALTVMGLTGGILALLFAVLWGSVWAQWLMLAEFASWPPLTLPLPTLVFRHPHIVAFTVVMLAPSVLTLWRIRVLRPGVMLALAATAFVALASGSRTIWLAAAIATAVTIALLLRRHEWRPPTRGHLAIALAILLGLLVVLLRPGLGSQLLDRITTVASLSARGEIWSAAMHAWVTDPLSGSGPGTFVQALPLSGYFGLNDFTPRHADNALIQLLSEGGLIAVAGAALLVAVVIGRILRARRKAAVWAVLFFAAALASENPTDTAGVNALVVAWVALAIPAGVGTVRREPSRALRRTSMAAFAIVAAAYGSLSSASLVHDVGIGQASHGDLASARDSLQLATALDPGMGLYERELGIVALAISDVSSGVQHLRRALTTMPTDDTTARALAVAELAAGDHAAAARAIEAASSSMPRAEANLLMQASILFAIDGESGVPPLLQAIQRDPFVVGAPSWRLTFGGQGHEEELLRAASRGIDPAALTSLSLSYQPMWLRAMAGLGPPSPTELQGAREGGVLLTSQAWVLLLDCHITEASFLIRDAEDTEGRQGLYWFVRVAIAAAAGDDMGGVLQLARIVVPSFRAGISEQSALLDPAQDRRMYGRMSLYSVPGLPPFPAATDAKQLWIVDPFAAAERGAPQSRLATCR
jgi:O-antigen ligase